MTPATTCPPFDEAIDRFKRLLASEGVNADLLWVFRQDVVERRHRTYIKAPLTNDTALVESLYNEGLRRGHGIHLCVFCIFDSRPCCYIWLPEDEIAAEWRLLSGLKLSYPRHERRRIIPVSNWLHWKWLKWTERPGAGHARADDLPYRSPSQ